MSKRSNRKTYGNQGIRLYYKTKRILSRRLSKLIDDFFIWPLNYMEKEAKKEREMILRSPRTDDNRHLIYEDIRNNGIANSCAGFILAAIWWCILAIAAIAVVVFLIYKIIC